VVLNGFSAGKNYFFVKKSKQKSSTNTMSSGIKKIKPQIKKSWYHSNTS
jgi:hypothetical protein